VLKGTTVAENAKEFKYRFETPDTALFELVK